MDKFIENIDFYIDQFYLEKQLYKKGQEFLAKGWLSKREFLTICLWKSRRPKRWYLKNSESTIKNITRKAFSEDDEANKMELLIELNGVQIPTASAILSVTDPKSYPIIDVRCIGALKDLGLIKWERITTNNWLNYLSIVREIAKENGKDAREIEKGLFAYNRILLDKEYKNLYE